MPRIWKFGDSVNTDDILPGKFVTCCYLTIDSEAGRITYANAGHNPPLVLHANGSVTRLDATGVVLGVFPDARIRETLRHRITHAADADPAELVLLHVLLCHCFNLLACKFPK